jgi:prepilin-type N-terminal cleavage/methylation domain-containing protein
MEGGEIKMQKLRKYAGFTLIELLVVIAIIGILAAVVLVSLNSARLKSRDARRVSDIHQLQTALELYYNDCGGYPQQATALDIVGGAQKLYSGVITNGVCAATTFGATAAGTTYLGQTPLAPTPADGTCTAAQNTYDYQSVSPYNEYTLNFCLGGQTGSLVAGAHSATSAGIQ